MFVAQSLRLSHRRYAGHCPLHLSTLLATFRLVILVVASTILRKIIFLRMMIQRGFLPEPTDILFLKRDKRLKTLEGIRFLYAILLRIVFILVATLVFSVSVTGPT